jgi:serine/threonine protein phosphatase 1
VIYAIGDIHGELRKLEELLEHLPLASEDRLVFIGDYVDRGPNSAQVLDLLVQIRSTRPGTFFLRGNHEQMMLDALAYFERKPGEKPSQEVGLMWFLNGAAATLTSYPERPQHWRERIPLDHWNFVRETRMELHTEHFHFVHAGVLPKHMKWRLPGFDYRLWIREPFLASQEVFGSVIVFGHTPQASGKPLITHNKIGIDTGVAYGGPLTAVG